VNNALPLTIVIPCKDDFRVLECIASVDVECEILVVVNGSTDAFVAEITPALAARGAQMACLEEANLSAALQHGVNMAQHDAILFMDADCLFEQGTISQLYAAMEAGGSDSGVYKGMVCFDSGPGLLSQLIARSRHIHTSAPPTAFKPPLLVHRCLTPRIGGYFFNARLLWKEDADLDWRLRQAGIAVVVVPEAKIHHAALELRADLRSNYRYGVGAALGKLMSIPLTTPDRSLWRTLQSDGPAVASYMALVNVARTIGYHWTLVSAVVDTDD
jgi:glycosyltransferase involved in cell wall biosynthesis